MTRSGHLQRCCGKRDFGLLFTVEGCLSKASSADNNRTEDELFQNREAVQEFWNTFAIKSIVKIESIERKQPMVDLSKCIKQRSILYVLYLLTVKETNDYFNCC